MCVDQRCIAVSSVIKAGCPHKCGLNGECNNLGKCHCKVGFDPPHCQHFGAGGSEDGGPASDPNGKRKNSLTCHTRALTGFIIMCFYFQCGMVSWWPCLLSFLAYFPLWH